MKYTINNLSKRIRIVIPDLYLWHSYLDYSEGEFVLYDVDLKYHGTSWNFTQEQLETSFLNGTDPMKLQEDVLEAQIKDMLETTDTIRRKVCITKNAWEILKEILKNPEGILPKHDGVLREFYDD